MLDQHCEVRPNEAGLDVVHFACNARSSSSGNKGVASRALEPLLVFLNIVSDRSSGPESGPANSQSLLGLLPPRLSAQLDWQSAPNRQWLALRVIGLSQGQSHARASFLST